MRVFIFGTMIAYGVKIAMKSPDQCCDLWVKGQAQIMLKICHPDHSVNSSSVFHWRVFISSTMIVQRCVDCNKGFQSPIWPWSQRSRSNILKLEDLKVLRRSPDLFKYVKIGQGQLQLIINHILFYHIWGLQPFWSSDLKQSNEYSIKQPSDSELRCLDRYMAVQMSGIG